MQVPPRRMLSYRHAFHAGNFADVFKHVLLVALLQALTRKDKPLSYLETHAGAGRYDLAGREAARTAEHRDGVWRVAQAASPPAVVARYLALLRVLDPSLPDGGTPRWYPGSPLIASSMLRQHDRLTLCELHPADADALESNFAGDRRVGVHRRDGYEALHALLPPTPRRGLVLVDPSYEVADEIALLQGALMRAFARWPVGVVAIWYPLLARKPMTRLHESLRCAPIPGVLAAEMLLRPADAPLGMNGCGMLIANPPWRLENEIGPVLQWLARVLAGDTRPATRLWWLRHGDDDGGKAPVQGQPGGRRPRSSRASRSAM